MEIEEIRDKKIWEDFALNCEDKTFLQSWNWGEFQEKMREKIWRFGVYEDKELFAVALTVKVNAKRGKFLLVPHGPIMKNFNYQTLNLKQITNLKSEILNVLLKKLMDIAKEEEMNFVRINPIWERSEENNDIFRQLGFRTAPIQMHPEASWKLKIDLQEDELLINMRKTTRYLIRQALKNPDIQIEKSVDIKDVELFSKMHEKVSNRQKFVPFSLNYLTAEFLTFKQDDQIILFFGKHKGELAAASFVVFWSGIGFYHHAASFPKYAKFSIPYLLQWEAIKEAKKRGCRLYDFWGFVDPKKEPNHPWAGPTLFKMGFGGKTYEYVKTRDFLLSKKYWLTYIIEKIRKIKRGL
ncbi:MAG: peptidoglycan bridge formation glycyltransferase FemA/FemB family protein [bacterium]|nr:peptidoglycan bridge formation glycyltransferase FemA/FemB family protein [bacterium]